VGNHVAICGHEGGVIKESERPPVTDWVSTDGFTAIYRDCAERVYNFFLRHGCSAVVAEELTASTFVAAWRARHRIADIEVTPIAYLYGIANNVLRTSWRSERRRTSALGRVAPDFAEPDEGALVDQRLADQAEARRLIPRINALPDEQREVVSLCLVGGLSQSEAAVVLDLPVGTVKSRLSRATARLRSSHSLPMDRNDQ
jgi:RNA polymerase sigma factor (sigma-70 family)